MQIPILDTAPEDKIRHALAGVVLYAIACLFWYGVIAFTPKPITGLSHQLASMGSALVTVYIIAGWKEWVYDKRTPGRHSDPRDLWATFAGGVLGAACTLPWVIGGVAA